MLYKNIETSEDSTYEINRKVDHALETKTDSYFEGYYDKKHYKIFVIFPKEDKK